jgi:uncharacterized membrane protein YcaP (DUF421 family)
MSLGEKLYLVMIVSLFISFIMLVATLSWLDAKEEKVRRWQDRKAVLATQRAQVTTRAAAPPKTAFHSG